MDGWVDGVHYARLARQEQDEAQDEGEASGIGVN
jgi:hypothetical protein